MHKVNPLAGLIGQYDYSDDDSDEESASKFAKAKVAMDNVATTAVTYHETDNSTIHPAPIPHCAWSACYDESSGFTYYWNQHTNEVTWEAPREYLLALKVAQQQIHSAGSTEVSAAEWQLYQQALLEKQNAQCRAATKSNFNTTPKPPVKKAGNSGQKPVASGKKRSVSESDEEKIELITSYHNSDSESNDESDTSKKSHKKPIVNPNYAQVASVPKPHKKQKTKSQILEYGPVMPPNQNYTVPIGPELPLEVLQKNDDKDGTDKSDRKTVSNEVKKTSSHNVTENEESQDDDLLFEELKDKAKLLQKLGGELPSDLKNLIKDEKQSKPASPDTLVKISNETSRDSKSTIDTNIDDLLEEIEKKEMKKVKSKDKVQIDMFGDDASFEIKSLSNSRRGSSEEDKCEGSTDEIKPLIPGNKSIDENVPKCLFPSSANIEQNGNIEGEVKLDLVKKIEEKKGANLYIMESNEMTDNISRKKLRISSSVLPEKKRSDVPTYTTKYSHYIEGVSNVHTGLGFNANDDSEGDMSERTVNYGKGLMFTKGEVLNDSKKVVDETQKQDLEDSMDLLDSKLKYLCQQQVYPISPVQEMMIQMQTLKAAWDGKSLAMSYLRKWASSARDSLDRLEATAAPPGWRCHFLRDAGQYAYTREADGFTQLTYPTTPAPGHDDMDISTTPPPPEEQEEALHPPLPRAPSPPPPPPPTWTDPPPPGTEPPRPLTPPPPPPPPPITKESHLPKKEILGDELLSFYKDIAELENQTNEEVKSEPETPPTTPPPPPPPVLGKPKTEAKLDVKQEAASNVKSTKKKSKVKISSSIGRKHKTVSNMVAKWQQVADEINSD